MDDTPVAPAPQLVLRFGDVRSHNWLRSQQPAHSLVQWWETGLFLVVGHQQAARLGLLPMSADGDDYRTPPPPALVQLQVAGSRMWLRLGINPGDEREGIFGSEAFRRFVGQSGESSSLLLDAAPVRSACGWCGVPSRCSRLVVEPLGTPMTAKRKPDEHLLRRHLHGLCIPASWRAEVLLCDSDLQPVRLFAYPEDDSDRNLFSGDDRGPLPKYPCQGCGRQQGPGLPPATGSRDGVFFWLDGMSPLEWRPHQQSTPAAESAGFPQLGTDVVWWNGGFAASDSALSEAEFRRTVRSSCDPAAVAVLEAVLRVRALGDSRWRRAAERRGVPVRASVLLRGPRGSGKTWMVREFARGLGGLRVLRLGFAELMELADGEAWSTGRHPAAAMELVWRRLFRARPSVLFLDHIDLLFPATGRCDAQRQQLAATFRLLLRELEAPGATLGAPGVVVIGATQLPAGSSDLWHRGVDAGFQIHLDLVNPGLKQRVALLQAAFPRSPDHPHPNLEQPNEHQNYRFQPVLQPKQHLSLELAHHVAQLCQGWSPADLAELCRRARELLAAQASRHSNRGSRHLKDHSAGGSGELQFGPSVGEVLLACVPSVQAGLRTQAGSEIGTSVGLTGVTWEDVGGLRAAKRALREAVVWPFRHPEALRRLRISGSSGVLLYGPPGTGKTLLAKAAAQESGASFIAVSPAQLLFGGVGQSERALVRLFEEARANAPCVVFLDEIQALFGVRQGEGACSSSSSSDVGRALVHTFVQLVDQLAFAGSGSPAVTVLAATNIPQAIDPILLRPGRLSRLIYCGLPNRAARAAIIQPLLRSRPDPDLIQSHGGGAGGDDNQNNGERNSQHQATSSSPSSSASPPRSKENTIHEQDVPEDNGLLRLLAARTKGFSGADVVQLMRMAALCEAMRDPMATAISHESYLQALALVRPSVAPETVRGLHLWGYHQRRRLM